MTLRIVVVALALSVGLFAKVSQAGLITIEPDDYCEGCIIAPSDGTNVSYAYTPHRAGSEIVYSPVYAVTDRYEDSRPIAPTGSLGMGAHRPLLSTLNTRFTSALTSLLP